MNKAQMTIVSRVQDVHHREFKFVGADCLDRALRRSKKSACIAVSIRWGNIDWFWSK